MAQVPLGWLIFTTVVTMVTGVLLFVWGLVAIVAWFNKVNRAVKKINSQ